MGRVVPICFWTRKEMYEYLYLCSIYKNLKTDKQMNVQGGDIRLKCGRVMCVVISCVQWCRWRCASIWMWLEYIKHWSVTRRRPLFLLQNLIESKHPSHSLHRWCSLLLWSAVLTSSTFCDSKSNSQLRDRRSCRLSFRFLTLSASVLPNFKKIVERESLIIGVHHFEVVSSIVRTNLRDCHNVFRVRGKRRKSGDWCR